MLFENKGLQCTDCTMTWQRHERSIFMLEHNNDSINVPSLWYYTTPVRIFLFRIKRTLWHIRAQKWPISHCAANIWICPLSYQSLHCFKRMQFLVHPVNKGLVPIHYKYFIRNLTLHHFLLSPEVWNIRISINLTVMS